MTARSWSARLQCEAFKETGLAPAMVGSLVGIEHMRL